MTELPSKLEAVLQNTEDTARLAIEINHPGFMVEAMGYYGKFMEAIYHFANEQKFHIGDAVKSVMQGFIARQEYFNINETQTFTTQGHSKDTFYNLEFDLQKFALDNEMDEELFKNFFQNFEKYLRDNSTSFSTINPENTTVFGVEYDHGSPLLVLQKPYTITRVGSLQAPRG